MLHKKWYHNSIVIFMIVTTCLNLVSPVIPAAAYAEQPTQAEISPPQNAQLAADLLDPPPAGWKAYNDVVYDDTIDLVIDPNGQSVHYIGANVTTFGIGTNFSGSTNGELLDQTTGILTGVTATFTQSGGVIWQPTTDGWGSGYDTAAGTDARQTFGGIADMTGVVYYGPAAGWWVDLTFTGLDPAKEYSFATSSARNNPEYTNRLTVYTLTGADSLTNASTVGVDVLAPNSVRFNTGDNYYQGYVARWKDIDPGDDGTFTVRAEADSESESGYKAYTFDVFMLQEELDTPPTPPYTLNVTVVGNGSVSKDPDQASYTQDQSVTLTPNPAAGWVFSEWAGDLSGSTNPETLVMNTDKNVTAIFVEQLPQHTLTINLVGSGTVTQDPDQTSYDENSSVELSAVPEEGWTFTEWSGGLTGNTNPETVVMDSDKTITATFVEGGLPTYTLTTSAVGNGSVTRSPDKAEYDLGRTGGVDCKR